MPLIFLFIWIWIIFYTMEYCSILEDALQLRFLFCYYDWQNSILINYYTIFEFSHLTWSESKFPKDFILDISNYMIHNLKFSCDSEEKHFFSNPNQQCQICWSYSRSISLWWLLQHLTLAEARLSSLPRQPFRLVFTFITFKGFTLYDPIVYLFGLQNSELLKRRTLFSLMTSINVCRHC